MIADNMLLRCDIARVQKKLNLTDEEVAELQQNLKKRDQDVEYENQVLKEMNATHLQKIMSLDRSQLHKYSIPEKTIMSQKSWERVNNLIQKHSQTDYHLCTVGDLRRAQKFLAKRGLPLSDAGEWGNDCDHSRTVANDFEEPIPFTWKEPEETSSTKVPPVDKKSALDFQPGISTNIDPRLLSYFHPKNMQPRYSVAAKSSTAGSGDKGKAQDISGYTPSSDFWSESASDLPLLRRLVSRQAGMIMLQQPWPPRNADFGVQKEQGDMNRDGQVIGDQFSWDLGLTELNTAATTGPQTMQAPVEASSAGQRSVVNYLGSEVTTEDVEAQVNESFLPFINQKPKDNQKPKESQGTPCQENPWGEIVKGAGTCAVKTVSTGTVEPGRSETVQGQQVALPREQR